MWGADQEQGQGPTKTLFLELGLCRRRAVGYWTGKSGGGPLGAGVTRTGEEVSLLRRRRWQDRW